jgi:hypothetical protein
LVSEYAEGETTYINNNTGMGIKNATFTHYKRMSNSPTHIMHHQSQYLGDSITKTIKRLGHSTLLSGSKLTDKKKGKKKKKKKKISKKAPKADGSPSRLSLLNS